MNIVQFINELFIFVALILVMPLANNLTNLVARNNVGWCLYGVLLLCIIFNILILLIRACGIMCQYIKARKGLKDVITNVELEKEEAEESVGPFDPDNSESNNVVPPVKRVKVPTYSRPLARDFPTFGYGSVTNSIQSLNQVDL